MSKLLSRASPCVLLLALAACATSAPPSPGPVAVAPGAARTNYGLYLAGQAAQDSGDAHAAAEFFAQAQAADPAEGFIKERAFTAALMAGDVSGAAAMAPAAGEGAAGTRAAAVLTQAVEALASGRGADAYAALQDPAVAGSEPAMLLKPWAAAAAGRLKDSLTLPDTPNRLVRMISQVDEALLLERAHRFGEAETNFKALMRDSAAQAFVFPVFGGFLERRGRSKEAVDLYDQLLRQEPDDSVLLEARARAAAHRKPPAAPTLREGAALALMGPAAESISEHQPGDGLVYLRLALRLDPGRSDAWLLAGSLIEQQGDMRAAREAYASITLKSPRYAEARTRLAWTYQAEDKPAALKIARETVAARPDSAVAKLNLAELLRDDGQFEEAARVLDPVIAAAGDRADWRLYYMRAVSLERSGRWPDAERDLQKALQVQPDQPEVLNYLGYSWVNRGERVTEGLAMIQRAVDAQPDEGAYVDSLGWAQYRLGRYATAVETLERAVSLDAGDAEINDHLGDAYWRVGRKDEARFQWTAVLTMKPDDEIKARAEAKLASALGPDYSGAPSVVASQ